MPGSARTAQVDLSTTPYYHCISRCVRRAFLCGQDDYTGQSYDHRKGWFLERLDAMKKVFAIDVCAYAVMSNHFHVVLRVDEDRAAAWTDEAVLRRYGRLFRNAAAEARALPERARRARVAVFRQRLTDISWFMRVINEHVARRANKEDKCTGRFWEGRFKSQALLDEAAVLMCMSYVDLNPVRAGIADSLEGSAFTSIQQRLREVAAATATAAATTTAATARSARRARREAFKTVALAALDGEAAAGVTGRRPSLGFRFDDYVELLEWTGRAAGAKAGGRIRGAPPEILGRLRIETPAWLAMMTLPGLSRLTTLGDTASVSAEAARRGKRWLKGTRAAAEMFR